MEKRMTHPMETGFIQYRGSGGLRIGVGGFPRP